MHSQGPSRFWSDALSARAFPVLVCLIVLTTVFVVETGIMFAMPLIERFVTARAAIALLDALLLTLVVSPVMWFAVVRPLRRVSEHRARLLGAVLNAQEEERVRLSRDLHDELGQQLTAALVALRTHELATDDSTRNERIASVRTIVAAALESVRGLSRGLRPSGLAELGLVASVERVCRDVLGISGVDAQVDSNLPSGWRMPRAVEAGVFRIIQEALTNAAKHAHATHVRVRMSLTRAGLDVEVRDDGKGIAGVGEPTHGMGMRSMRERAALMDGVLQVVSGPGRGTSVRLSIPRMLLTEQGEVEARGTRTHDESHQGDDRR